MKTNSRKRRVRRLAERPQPADARLTPWGSMMFLLDRTVTADKLYRSLRLQSVYLPERWRLRSV